MGLHAIPAFRYRHGHEQGAAFGGSDLTGGELIQVPGTCIERVKLIDPGFSKIKKVMGVLVLKTFSLYILYGGENFFLYGTTP